jgi:hypothetical protein
MGRLILYGILLLEIVLAAVFFFSDSEPLQTLSAVLLAFLSFGALFIKVEPKD